MELPDSCFYIGSFAFYGCVSLEELTLPAMLNTINPGLFYGCAFSELELPSRITAIGEQAFLACRNLTSIEIPGKVTSIGDRAFYSCIMLEEVDLPDSLTYVAPNAFDLCPVQATLPDLSDLVLWEDE